MKVQKLIVLGGGSAGLIAAITLKTKLPHFTSELVRSSDIGVIGVGEGTTAAFPRHFFEYLKLDPREFYEGRNRRGSWVSAFCGDRVATSTTRSPRNTSSDGLTCAETLVSIMIRRRSGSAPSRR